MPPVSREPEYQKFVEATGFQFERDLDQAASPSTIRRAGPGVPPDRRPNRASPRSSSAKSTPAADRISKEISSSIEDYHGFDIYNIPLEGRTVRVVMLSYDSVAVSNHPDPNVIRGVLDRSRKLASPFGGPWLLRKFYRKVPLASLSFAILRMKPEMSSLGGLGSWGLLFPKPAVAVISARYLRALHLRAEAFTDSDADAHAITEKTSAFLSLFHAAEGSVGAHGTDSDVKAFFDSLKVEQSGDRAILTAAVPPGFIQKALAEARPNATAPAPSISRRKAVQAQSR